jgi:hypothetical protein
MPVDPSVAFNTLVANPGEFLKRYPVRIFGATAASGVAQYVLSNRAASFRPGRILGTLNMHATESFDIRSAAIVVGPGGGHRFQAHSVHMDVGTAAMGFYRLDGAGPNIMLTGQLSGCSFVMMPAGVGSIDVAHIKPHQISGKAMHANLGGAFANAAIYGDSTQGGFYDSDSRVVSIVGVRSGGQWRIYAQKQKPGHAMDYSIKSVYQIFPTKQKLT